MRNAVKGKKGFQKVEDDRQRFFRMVDRTSECWEWRGATDHGYGTFWFNGRSVRAHRWAFENLANKEIPPGYFVCHRCDNPPCVNPEHLFAGTNSDNMLDCHAKGRSLAKKDRKRAAEIFRRNRKKQIGDKHFGQKLDLANTIAVLNELRDGASQRRLGEKYGVSSATIYNIAKGNTHTAREAIAAIQKRGEG